MIFDLLNLTIKYNKENFIEKKNGNKTVFCKSANITEYKKVVWTHKWGYCSHCEPF